MCLDAIGGGEVERTSASLARVDPQPAQVTLSDPSALRSLSLAPHNRAS
jgi:hypothetical protein